MEIKMKGETKRKKNWTNILWLQNKININIQKKQERW